jgi:2-phosphosulfolactate phosphatase
VVSFLNATAAADKIADADDVVILCAGREGRFALEDAVCAGLIGRNLALRGGVRPTDSARAAMVLARGRGGSPEALLARTAAGRQLRRLDLGADIAYCAMVDRFTQVPEMRDLRITL